MSEKPAKSAKTVRRTQTERREATRAALVEAAARGFSRDGYTALKLDRVAAEAGYTRGALYHLFNGKEDLALAVIDWVRGTWDEEVGQLGQAEVGPVAALVGVARGHALFCRRHGDVARVMTALNVEFSARDHPVRDALQEVKDELVRRVSRLVTAGRRTGEIPDGPPARAVALAFIGGLEGVVVWLSGNHPHDTELAERLTLGILGLTRAPEPVDVR